MLLLTAACLHYLHGKTYEYTPAGLRVDIPGGFLGKKTGEDQVRFNHPREECMRISLEKVSFQITPESMRKNLKKAVSYTYSDTRFHNVKKMDMKVRRIKIIGRVIAVATEIETGKEWIITVFFIKTPKGVAKLSIENCKYLRQSKQMKFFNIANDIGGSLDAID